MSRPTLLQSVFNQPSQKYALSPNVKTNERRSSSSFDTQRSVRWHHHASPGSTLSYASQKLTAFLESPRLITDHSQMHTHLSHAHHGDDDDDDMFFTPLSSPIPTPKHPPSPSCLVPSMSSSSVTEEEEEDDDLFSSQSTATSLTSFSAGSISKAASDQSRKSSRSRRPHSVPGIVADWSRGVRWLVPPDSLKRRSQPSTTPVIHSLDLVDVDYDLPPSRFRKGTRSNSERMSAVLEEEEDDELPVPRTAPSSPSSPRRARSASTYSRATSTTAPLTVSIPSPLPVSAGTASSTGYTSLTLPRAAYTPSKHRISRSVDITRSGLAQTTMASIAVTSRPRPAVPAHLRPSVSSPLAFTSNTPPPSKVNAREVLVQVWAVAVDSLDTSVIEERAARSDGLGFVPGRSFVGRAIETGWEVSAISRGDWVIGLTDVRKCGALAEFLVVDRCRLHKAPHSSSAPHLTVNQLASLPLVGVPAHRAVRTLAHLLPTQPRVLVLHSHFGAGLLATQELLALGARVVAHVPGKWGDPAEMRVRDMGARDVRVDEGRVVDFLGEAPEEAYDAVLDTAAGGKDVWTACRRLLRPSGQFTTLVGERGGLRKGKRTGLGVNAHYKSTMRSLWAQRVGYEWVSPIADVDREGADVRDSLGAVVRLAEEGVYVPYVDEATVVPFERAVETLVDVKVGSVVVRIVE